MRKHVLVLTLNIICLNQFCAQTATISLDNLNVPFYVHQTLKFEGILDAVFQQVSPHNNIVKSITTTNESKEVDYFVIAIPHSDNIPGQEKQQLINCQINEWQRLLDRHSLAHLAASRAAASKQTKQ